MTYDLTDLVLKHFKNCELDGDGAEMEETMNEIMSEHINIDDGDTITVTVGGREWKAIVIHPDDNEDLFNFVIAGGEQMDIFDWLDLIAPVDGD